MSCDSDCLSHHAQGDTKPKIHIFSANWCGHCKDFKIAAPQFFYNEFDDQVTSNEHTIPDTTISVVNHRDEDSETWKEEYNEVKSYPCVLFAKPGLDGKTITEVYEGARKFAMIKKAFEEFINQK